MGDELPDGTLVCTMRMSTQSEAMPSGVIVPSGRTGEPRAVLHLDSHGGASIATRDPQALMRVAHAASELARELVAAQAQWSRAGEPR